LYPALLLEIPQPPPLLYYKGILKDADETMIAIVGTRNITTYGRSIVPEITAGLAKQNITIVSGLAFGVDALAHQTCVNEKRRTIAIVGSGIDSGSIYPKHHQFLAEQILETGGVIISEYPPQTPAYKQHFIARNRIISGVSAGTLVVEANLKSGALITARHALDQNRPVYAIPGPIYNPGSEGPHNLIRMGAQLVTKTEHILEDLLIETSETNTELDYTDLTPEQLQTYSQLSREPKGINEIIRTSKLDAGTVTAALVFLEMKGVIQNIGGQQYIITHRTTK
jgi:DNA processing protein